MTDPVLTSEEREKGLVFAPKFDEAGLLTAVVVDASDGTVLVVAHMNADALAATLAKPEFAEFTLAGPGFVGGVFGLGTGAGLRKEDTKLKDMLNAAIDSAIADGTIKRISEKWVGTDVTPVK